MQPTGSNQHYTGGAPPGMPPPGMYVQVPGQTQPMMIVGTQQPPQMVPQQVYQPQPMYTQVPQQMIMVPAPVQQQYYQTMPQQPQMVPQQMQIHQVQPQMAPQQLQQQPQMAPQQMQRQQPQRVPSQQKIAPREPTGPPPASQSSQLVRKTSASMMMNGAPPPNQQQIDMRKYGSGRNLLFVSDKDVSKSSRSKESGSVASLTSKSKRNFFASSRKGSSKAVKPKAKPKPKAKGKNSSKKGQASKNLRKKPTKKTKNIRKNKKKDKKKDSKKKAQSAGSMLGRATKPRYTSFNEMDVDDFDVLRESQDPRESQLHRPMRPSFAGRESRAGSRAESEPDTPWSVQWSDEFKKPYYFNKFTGESLWEPPEEVMNA